MRKHKKKSKGAWQQLALILGSIITPLLVNMEVIIKVKFAIEIVIK